MKRRILDLLGLMLVGDGLVTMLEPERHCLLWEVGPEPCRKMMETFSRHPSMTRSFGFLELAAGVWLSIRQESEESLFSRFLR